MIVLTAIVAALYSASIAVLRFPPPVSIVPISQIFPIPLSLMFGPAGAWGIAIGSVIGSLVTGEFSINQLFGFIGNFVLGITPYLLWTRLSPFSDGKRDIRFNSARYWFLYFFVALGAAFSTAVIISFPMHLLGLVPFSFLVNLIGVQDFLIGLFAVIFLRLIYKRVESLGLLYWEVMDESDLDQPQSRLGVWGAWMIVISSVLAWLIGAFIIPEQASLVGGIGSALILVGIILCLIKRNSAETS
ncbi:MAG: QueT transporter family protein [Pyrinomonadaceae bacterium]|nr:QueT transporter family protein [Pyrinomonadaceae bacterium]